MFLPSTNNLISKHFQYHTRVIAVDSISLSFLIAIAHTHTHTFTQTFIFTCSSIQCERCVKWKSPTSPTALSYNNHPVAHSRPAFYSWFEMNFASFYVPYHLNYRPFIFSHSVVFFCFCFAIVQYHLFFHSISYLLFSTAHSPSLSLFDTFLLSKIFILFSGFRRFHISCFINECEESESQSVCVECESVERLPSTLSLLHRTHTHTFAQRFWLLFTSIWIRFVAIHNN